MFIEKERSYIFRFKDIVKITKLFPYYSSTPVETDVIEDYYLNKNIRIRKKNGKLCMEHKSDGKKEEGRKEENQDIGENWFNLLKEKSSLKIIKKRQILHIEPNDYIITLDIISEPMRILILEIESLNGNDPPRLENFISDLHGKFITCPLSAWDYFKRKIAICGAPSSGKTSTAQWITNKINTEFGGRAFCPIEYATSFIQKYDKIPNINDQYMIWECQNTRENNSLSKCNMVISDSPTFLSYVYGLLISENIDINDKNILLSKLYKRSLEGLCKYQQIFFLNLMRYKENGIRYNTKNEAVKINNMIKNFLNNHGIKFGDYTFNHKEQILSDILYFNGI
jgi:hypothetical protein